MAGRVRTCAIFDSDAFNLTEPKDYFINPCCFGDDLAHWMLGKLKERGFEVDEEPGQEHFGWYIIFAADNQLICVVIGGFEETRWWITVERHLGFFASVTGARNRNVPEAAVKAIHALLSDAPEIAHLAWYPHAEFKKGNIDESAGTPAP